MEHKGLIQTFTFIAIIAIMVALIAYSLSPSTSRNILLDSYPSGAEVYLDGQNIGKTPLNLDEAFFAKHGFAIDRHSILKLFNHELAYIEISAPTVVPEGEKPKLKAGKLTFATFSRSANVPQIFDKEPPLNEVGTQRKDIEALMMFPQDDRLIAIFDRNRFPPMGNELRAEAEVSVFAQPLANSGFPMTDFKSCKIKTSPDFRIKK